MAQKFSLKSSSFHIEDMYVTGLERLKKLFCLVMIAFVRRYKIGDYIDEYHQRIQIEYVDAERLAYSNTD